MAASAQPYPNKPITLVVGLAPGSGQDTSARAVSRRAGEILGVQIVVENKPGAGTMTASLAVAKAPPDGYTLLQNGPALSVNPSLYKQVPYDAAKDFVPVAFLFNLPMIVVINPSLDVSTLGEFLAKYRNSDHLTYAHPGAGTMPHLRDPVVREEIKGLGFVPRMMTPEEFAAFLQDEMARWPAIVAAAGISAE
jgi:tripartite-type tricarboxylate transporter receptor subunit TctC